MLKRDYSVFIGDVDSDVARGELPYHLKDKTREKKNGLLKMGYVDITNPKTFHNIPENCDTIIQTAGYFKFWPVDKEKAWQINYHGTRNLVEHASRTQKNHFYDTSFTRERLGLKKEDYFGLEESIENVVKYMKDRAII